MRGGLQHIVKGLRPVPYLLKVASGEVRPRFKVGPLNEISNFVFGGFGVGLHPIAGHCFEECQFNKGSVRLISCPSPKFDIWLTRMSLIRANFCSNRNLNLELEISVQMIISGKLWGMSMSMD